MADGDEAPPTPAEAAEPPGTEARASESPAEPASGPGPAEAVDVGRSGPQVIAIAAGRGGTGKSLLAANMAIYLAQLGKRVVAIDGDPAGGSLHLLLGAARPTRGYADFLRKRVDSLGPVVVDTPVAGVGLVAGEGAVFAGAVPKQTPRAVVAAIRALETDYVVLDLGPPDSPLCIDVWLGADIPILVTMPDPASVEATYRFVKSAFVRRLRTIRGLDRLVANATGEPPAAADLYRTVAAADGPASRLADEIATFRPRLVVGQTRSLADLKLGIWMASAGQRRLGHPFEYLGHLESDEAVWVAARRRRPLVSEYPESKAAKNIERIVRRMLVTDPDHTPPPQPLRVDEEHTHYEVLETEPGVSDEEIRRAFRRIREIYAEGSLAVAGLYDEAELGTLHAQVQSAHDVLFAPDRRRAYDLALPEGDLARAVRTAAKLTVPRAAARLEPAEPVIAIDEEITGDVLRKVREARGLDLADVAQRTKISERHLRSIEEERWKDMPAAVYVRGFVVLFARALRIDATRAATEFMRRFQQGRGFEG